MRIAITGGTGLIGSALRERLEAAGHEAVAIRRGPETDPASQWDPAAGWVRDGAFAGYDAVVHLSGASIGEGRWSAARRDLLRSSRIDSTRTLVEHLGSLPGEDRPEVLVSQSAVGYYGARGDEELTEAAAPGTGFLADLVIAWEREATRAEEHGIRTVRHRSAIVLSRQGPPLSRLLLPFRLGVGGTGFLADLVIAWEREATRAEEHGIRTVRHRSAIVLSRQGPPLSRLLLPFRLGVGGNLGNGRWWMPWVTLEDEVRSIEHALTHDVSGPINVSAPDAVTNAGFTQALGRALRRPTLFPLPMFAYRLAFGQDPDELFASQRVVPQALAASGFEFAQPDIDSAFASLLG